MTKKPQIEKFRDEARELGADKSADKFDATLRKIAASKPDPKAIDKLADMGGKPIQIRISVSAAKRLSYSA
jgi:hypothetical protein